MITKCLMNNIKEAFRELIDLLAHSEIEVNETEITERWLTSCRIARQRKKRLWMKRLLATASAAAVAALVYFSVDFNYEYDPDNIELYALQQRPISDSTNPNIQLILSEGEVMNISGSESNINYAYSGKVIVDADTVNEKTDDLQPRYNQLIVPYGKRTRLSLSDGSRLCVNSGTRVVYPLRFGTGDREIYVEGEAYLEVAKDESRPFIVKTGQFEVKVLGTKFNVFAYPDAAKKQIVLVEGSVLVDNSKTSRKMKPGELVEQTSSGLSAVKKVNAEAYISWINNTLIYDNEPLSAIFERLHHYYGLSFDIKCDISNMYVSGKLDLQDTLEDVLASISFSVPVDCIRIGDHVSVCADR